MRIKTNTNPEDKRAALSYDMARQATRNKAEAVDHKQRCEREVTAQKKRLQRQTSITAMMRHGYSQEAAERAYDG